MVKRRSSMGPPASADDLLPGCNITCVYAAAVCILSVGAVTALIRGGQSRGGGEALVGTANLLPWWSSGLLRNLKSAEVGGCDRMEEIGWGPECQLDGVLHKRGDAHNAPRVALLRPLSVRAPPAEGEEEGEAPKRQAHGSNLLRLPSGELLLVFFSGTEGEDSVAIVMSRLEPGQTEWTTPEVVSVNAGRSAQNPVLWLDTQEEKLLLLHTSQAANRGQGTSDVRLLRSSDHGRTWGPQRVLFSDSGAFIRNQMLEGGGGEWLLPMYYTPDGYYQFETHYAAMKVTSDRGQTWAEYPITNPGEWLAQPSVVRYESRLLAFLRDRRSRHIHLSVSTDEGRTWSPAKPTRLPNNNSGLQAAVLQSGALALVFNNGQRNRFPLSIALSQDGGDTWPYVRDLETGHDPNLGLGGEFSYPSILQSPDGKIHVSFTWRRATIKYVELTESWIRQGLSVGMHKGSKEEGLASANGKDWADRVV